MNISYVKLRITENDIMSIIHDYLDVKELKIEKIKISNGLINVQGSYKLGISLPFTAVVGVGTVKEDEIKLKIFKLSAAKLRVSVKLADYVLGKLLKDLDGYGIKQAKGHLIVNFKGIQKLIPIVSFNLESLVINEGYIEIETKDINVNMQKETVSIEEIKEERKILLEKRVVVQDAYNKIRTRIIENVPDKYREAVPYVALVPDLIVLVYRLFKDKRVPLKIKAILGISVVYKFSPIDIINDVIPAIGDFDDIYMIFYALNMVREEVPEEVILDNWSGEADILMVIKDGTDYIFNTFGVKKISTVFTTISSVLLRKKRTKLKKKD
ncbi:YkvA family protein [Clostridium cellulovorans]|uniref:DUF1232 domain-containing protein n=1 Tax=Clostridium cellulovorans (strain ATCC 35296 / DSM 3052 / OCM 3 / 743B) TaxID=573061 RepID=D9SSU7_CLOC7|nr:DUF1232 domain-containing protein [Clostridium cellulovorans]ADL52609.1 protein of unknown function DUF1232 [Clostridium cellulovorans 743B]